jgi:hypothetical protein
MPVKLRDIIILNGPPKSGKDYLALLLGENFRVFSLAMAEPASIANYHAFCLSDNDEIDYDSLEADKHKKHKELMGKTWRETKIRTAETFNAMYGWNFWAKVSVNRVDALHKLASKQLPNSIKIITDLCFPEQIEVFEKEWEKRAILVRVHRQGATFGKNPGNEQDYGEGTGLDSRNWVFSSKIPQFDFYNYSDDPEQTTKNLIRLICDEMNYMNFAFDRNDKTLRCITYSKLSEYQQDQEPPKPFRGKHYYTKWIYELAEKVHVAKLLKPNDPNFLPSIEDVETL